MQIQILPEFSEKDRWLNHTLAPVAHPKAKTLHSCAKHIEDCDVGTEDRLVQNFELSKDFGSVNYQIYLTAVCMPYHPTKATRAASYMEPQTGSSTTAQSWANGSWSQTGQSWQFHWPFFGWRHSQRLVGPSEDHNRRWLPSEDHNWRWLPSEDHNWRWIFSYKRIIHRRQMDTTDTTGEHHDSHHTCSKQFAVVSPLFHRISKLARESFATSASAKQKASSLLSNDDNQRQECQHGLSRSTFTKIPSWRQHHA